ncbi:peptidoglycan recognition protein family protein [Bifidobacterium magnum]|uniref:N-acetylmuramoyl-L-alanine amidase n=1 Tax=Bifidobacterium magnum TaxID=1692 RepID=A0A087B6A6_9BIFI|nr:peptidoglycan recognition family protein [Bifidobacterium magnum]KFI66556.1 N-acetylmuramoyl-L-alanine amidase [Bifidobacterium magnum]
MKNWETLDADEVKLLTRHYTAGRAGHKIDKIILHHNAGNLSIQGCWDVWQTSEASAHYQVDSNGRIGQLVYDSDTAWHAGDALANYTGIGIEHADISSNPWRISDKCLDNGAHLVAALCRYYKLGRPQYGKNVFFHRDFCATECPASIAGSQRDAYFKRAGEWYDAMQAGKTNINTQQGDDDMVTTQDMEKIAKLTADKVWLHKLPSGAVARDMISPACQNAFWLRDHGVPNIMNRVAVCETKVTAMETAMNALAKSVGANPADIAKIVEDAVKNKLDEIDIQITATPKA